MVTKKLPTKQPSPPILPSFQPELDKKSLTFQLISAMIQSTILSPTRKQPLNFLKRLQAMLNGLKHRLLLKLKRSQRLKQKRQATLDLPPMMQTEKLKELLLISRQTTRTIFLQTKMPT
jgi:ClpP class serine protease